MVVVRRVVEYAEEGRCRHWTTVGWATASSSDMVAIDGCAVSVVDGAGGCCSRTMGVGTASSSDLEQVGWGWGAVSVVGSSIRLQVSVGGLTYRCRQLEYAEGGYRRLVIAVAVVVGDAGAGAEHLHDEHGQCNGNTRKTYRSPESTD